MERLRRVALALGLLLATIAVVPADASSSRILPEGDPDAIQIRIGKKRSSYHIATRAEPLEIAVTGPASIRLLSRILFASDPGTTPTTYQLCLEIDGVEIRTSEETATPSSKARSPEGKAVGSLEKAVIRIPEGRHRALIYPVEGDARVALRLFRRTVQAPKTKYVSFAPESYEEPILLHGSDSEVTYYRFNPMMPVTFVINGPVRMKALTRLDFNHERGYSQTYAIKISIDGELSHTSRLTAQASSTSIYPTRLEITPGVGKELMIEVPEGRHEVSIALDCTTASAAALRLLIPEDAVTNGP